MQLINHFAKACLMLAMYFVMPHIGNAQIPFQAKLLENNQPVNGTKNLTFSIQENGISWTETHSNHPVTNGLYSVVLGSQNALPANLFDGTNHRTLQISIGGVALTSVKVYQPFMSTTNTQSFSTKIAIIKDEKPSGTVGGTFYSGAWRTRDLNTLQGDTSFVSLQNNQFTLTKGTYVIEANVPSYHVRLQQAQVWNVTNQTSAISGNTRLSAFGGYDTGTEGASSKIYGVINIASQQTFEIQQYCLTSKVDTGFGYPGVFGINEVYTQVKITKIQ